MLPKVENTISVNRWLGYRFLVLDTPDGLWERTCKQNGVRVRVCDTWTKKGFKYVARFLDIRKRDLEIFIDVQSKVANAMIIRGCHAYIEYCGELKNLLEGEPSKFLPTTS